MYGKEISVKEKQMKYIYKPEEKKMHCKPILWTENERHGLKFQSLLCFMLDSRMSSEIPLMLQSQGPHIFVLQYWLDWLQHTTVCFKQGMELLCAF